ncbi:hypothetical protein DLM45_01060 [Hyphomicrobium methylovorum]|uniref:hypothetical protein n=1 Tax=Hyphomicrobium methylovorum TaxID=84 RepID=UPI0015E77D1C|nr:hypothetical protein [Hyphomicrobium methylovorum]MBA2124814.1 hypothetical protein [Hyphomicrobium methylovorum]
MQQLSYEFVDLSSGETSLPISLKQAKAGRSQLPGLIVMLTLAALIVLPQVALGLYAVVSPDIRATLAEQPLIAVELAVAFAFWAGLVCWPLRNIVMALLSKRSIEIGDGEVRVIDKTPFSIKAWRTPLATYEGISLNLRSSLSGVRSEAMLVHPDRRRSVILMSAPTIGEGELDALRQALGFNRRPPMDGPRSARPETPTIGAGAELVAMTA